MNFIELAKRTWLESGLAGVGPQSVTPTDAMQLRVVNWVADAWRDIQAMRNWDFLRGSVSFSTVIDNRDYSVTDIPALAAIRKWDSDFAQTANGVGSWSPLRWLPYNSFRSAFESADPITSRPTAITEVGGVLRLNTLPDAVYLVRLDGWLTGAKLTASSDTPVMPEQYHMAIVWRALRQYALSDNAAELMALAERSYAEVMSDLLVTEQEEVMTVQEPFA